MGDFFSGYRPLRPGEYRQNRDGSRSTEITMTVDMPDGSIALIPSLWSDPNGNFVEMDHDRALKAALSYEKTGFSQFPRFESYGDAGTFAFNRSNQGGARQPLAKILPGFDQDRSNIGAITRMLLGDK